MCRTTGRNIRAAFTLVEIAVVLVVVGMMSGLVLQSQQATRPSNCYTQTQQQLETISKALESFTRQKSRYPLPASRIYDGSNPHFGEELSGSTDTDNFTVSGHSVTTGAVPFKTLGLADSYAADCWGNKLTYLVTTELTSSDPSTGFPSSGTQGVISIKNGTLSSSTVLLSNAAFAVISHGEDGVGAVSKNYHATSHGWCAMGAHIDTKNCYKASSAGNAEVFVSTYNNGANAGANYFDDLVVFGGKKNTGCNADSYTVSWNTCKAVAMGPLHTGESQQVSNGPNDYATFRCVNGMMVQDTSIAYACGGNCTTDPLHGGGTSACTASCPTGSVSWGSGNCSASFEGIGPTGHRGPIDNGTANYTGSASVTCNSGSFAVDAGATCNTIPPSSCTGATLAWGTNCSGFFPTRGNGEAVGPVNNTAANYRGLGYATCSNGTWSVTGTSTCAASSPCSGGTLTWGSANHCSGTFPALASGVSSQPVANTASNYTGLATASCSNGSISVYGTCAATPATSCPATSLSWGGSCTGVFPNTPNGVLATGVANTVPGFSGMAMATCVNGSWVGNAASGSCAPVTSNTSCGSQTLTWGAGCQALFNPVNNGTSSPPMVNTAGGYTGVASSICDHGAWLAPVGSCTTLAANACPAMALNWSDGCRAIFPSTSNGATSPSINNVMLGNIGSATASCSMGNWSAPTGTCVPAETCPAQSITWGAGNACTATLPVTNTGSSVGTITSTTPGYSGAATATCNSDKTWSLSGTSCTTGTCPAGTVNWGSGCSASISSGSGSSVVSGINNAASGYSGTTTATCTSGSWALSGSSCSAVTCPAGTITWNTNCSATLTQGNYNTSPGATSNTATGYTGSTTPTCGSNGSWSLASSSCSAVTCPAGTITWNTNCSATLTQGSYNTSPGATSNTATGYTGSTTPTCGSNGSWSLASSSCSLVTCPATTITWGAGCSSSIASGNYNTSPGATSNTATGYTGSTTPTCGSNGSWSLASSSCSIVTCPATTITWGTNCSKAISAGNYNTSPGAVSNTAAGYTGSTTPTCGSNGSWSQASSSCTATLNATMAASPSYPLLGADLQTVFLNYPGAGQSIALTVTASGGTAPYSYAWSISGCYASASGALSNGNATFTVSPTASYACVNYDNNNYTVTAIVTDAASATKTVTKKINVVNPYIVGGGGNLYTGHKVAVRGGNVCSVNNNTPAQAANNFAQGDQLGATSTGSACRTGFTGP